MTLIDDLNALLNSMTIALDTPASPALGQLVKARITPLPEQILSEAPLGLDWFGKGFVFANALPNDTTVTGPLPVYDLTTVPPSVVAGVPGVIGKITGSMAIAVAPEVLVSWSVRDASNNILTEATHFIAPSGLSLPEITIIFIPAVTELTSAVPSPPSVVRYLHARVSVRVGTTQTAPRDLPPVKLVVPELGVPTVLGMMLHVDFKGATLVVVPSNSPFGSLGAVVNTLSDLQSRLAPLSSLARFAAFLLGLGTLTQVLQSEPHIQFRKTDTINNLNDITLIQRAWYQNDTEAEDELSSLILIGPVGRRAECCNDQGMDDGEGKFTVSVPNQLFVSVRSLHSKNPASAPNGNELTVNKTPPDGFFSAGSFGDELSSVRLS